MQARLILSMATTIGALFSKDSRLSGRIPSVPVQPIPAFSRDEVKKILDGFRTSPDYANYLDYVRFRLSLASRSQEVRDLKWKHISADFSLVWFSSNKTKKGRTVPLDPSIDSILSARRDRLKLASDDELVFTSREGLPIDNRNFRRIWTIVLAKVGVTYRKPYTTKKTSVRHSLLNGGNYIEVAAAAGHDPHTMHKYYGDAIQQNIAILFNLLKKMVPIDLMKIKFGTVIEQFKQLFDSPE
jgi:integrase